MLADGRMWLPAARRVSSARRLASSQLTVIVSSSFPVRPALPPATTRAAVTLAFATVTPTRRSSSVSSNRPRPVASRSCTMARYEAHCAADRYASRPPYLGCGVESVEYSRGEFHHWFGFQVFLPGTQPYSASADLDEPRFDREAAAPVEEQHQRLERVLHRSGLRPGVEQSGPVQAGPAARCHGRPTDPGADQSFQALSELVRDAHVGSRVLGDVEERPVACCNSIGEPTTPIAGGTHS